MLLFCMGYENVWCDDRLRFSNPKTWPDKFRYGVRR